ncbi:hypothetical protein F5B22DRAFT_661252 [Xylaria bambusicola]|uniref:uncharacterized protein n=1 Tax=Xylaria bambusicola TaxID=326684 RepID=UPI002008C461|nr:uncharacterized protein F5B22DRAFT_661252 [Xylaria bambusicola]KAI0521857.1 hypothetical protein F5B22DRAFT_661252 [Xylaria bambusicola]
MSLDQLHELPEWLQEIILNGPALAPPPGVKSNLDHPPNLNTLGIAVTTICLSISTIVFALAAYAKLYCMKKVHVEDFLVLSSYGLIVGASALLYRAPFTVGYFVHQWNARVKDLPPTLYLLHVGSLLYSVSIMLLKVAILLQWIRIFVPRGSKGTFYWTSYVLVLANILLYSSIVISICVACTPYYRIWDETAVGTCHANREIIYIAGAIGNLVSDVIITLLPQRVIWKLQVKTQKKIGIAFIFFVGLLTIISGGFKVDASIHLYLDDDKTYQTSAVAVWAIAELTCVLLVYCVPSIPKIFKDSRISIKLPSSFVSWLRSGSTKTDSGASSSLPSFEGKQIALSASRQSKLSAGAA